MSTVVTDVEVTMPQLGETVTEGTVTRWLKKVGESVSEQEPLLEVATDKVDTEIPAPANGIVLEIRVPEDATVPVGTVLARIGTGPSNSAADPRGANTVPVAAGPSRHEAAAPPPGSRPPVTARRHQHSPRMRKLARDLGVDLHSVVGTGPGGRVVRDDVLHAAGTLDQVSDQSAPEPAFAAASSNVAAPPLVSAVPATGIAGQPVPSSTAGNATVEIDVAHLRSAADPMRALVAVVAAEAMRALRRHGLISASVADVPELEVDGRVIGRAEDLNVAALLRRISGEVPPTQPSSGSSTRLALWSAGTSGVLLQTRPLRPEHLLAVGIGAIVERPVILRSVGRDHVIAVGSLAYLSVTYDAGRVDAATAVAFLTTVAARVSDPVAVQDLTRS